MQKLSTNVKATRKRTVEIETGDVRRHAEAVYATDPVHSDVAAAKKAGFSGVVAPPTFCGTLGSHSEVLTEMELNPRYVLHSEQLLNEYETVCAGDVLTITTTLVEQYEKPSGANNNGFVIIEDAGVNQKGKKVFNARRVYVVRGGFPRR
jgi:acyl dehydratase